MNGIKPILFALGLALVLNYFFLMGTVEGGPKEHQVTSTKENLYDQIELYAIKNLALGVVLLISSALLSLKMKSFRLYTAEQRMKNISTSEINSSPFFEVFALKQMEVAAGEAVGFVADVH